MCPGTIYSIFIKIRITQFPKVSSILKSFFTNVEFGVYLNSFLQSKIYHLIIITDGHSMNLDKASPRKQELEYYQKHK